MFFCGSLYDTYLYSGCIVFEWILLYLRIFFIYGSACILYNIVYNRTFYTYVHETQNYFLLLLPLHHKSIFVSRVNIGFVCYFLPQCAIAFYIQPAYRGQGKFTKCIQSYTGYVFTNNMKMVQHLQKYEYVLLVNIPYLRILQRHPSNETYIKNQIHGW